MDRGAWQASPWGCKELDTTEWALCEVWELWCHLFGDCFFSPWQFLFVWPHGFHHFPEQTDIQPKTQGFYCRFLELFSCAAPSSPYCVLRILPSLSSFLISVSATQWGSWVLCDFSLLVLWSENCVRQKCGVIQLITFFVSILLAIIVLHFLLSNPKRIVLIFCPVL